MPFDIDIKAANLVATLVTFEYGEDPTVYRYAIWPSDVVFDGVTFTSLPGMEVRYGKQEGVVKDSPATIDMRAVEPLASMKGSFPTVAVTIREVTPGDDSSVRMMWKGQISRTSFNYNGNAQAVRVTVAGWKARLDASISLVLSQFCPWSFGDGICGKDLSTIEESATVVSLDGNKITLSGLTTVSEADRWRFGEILVDGFPLSIHHHDIGTQVIYTVKQAPAYWVSRSAVLTPGCDQTPERCVFWGQQDRFAGIGVKIPNRDVRFQE